MAGFSFHGIHTSAFDLANQQQTNAWYAFSGINQVSFTGYNWYLMSSQESYNGHNFQVELGQLSELSRSANGHGTMFSWLSEGAFNGSGYSNIPVGCVGHPWEPGIIINDPRVYFGMWHSGFTFVECAWGSANGYISAPIGDPLVVK
jgi:hypothetical protein